MRKSITKKIIYSMLSFLTFMTVLSCSTSSIGPLPSGVLISELYVFGDSLSDVGTNSRIDRGYYPPDPPYAQGRYSNGRVWVEYLAAHLGLSSEQTHYFAAGGATTGPLDRPGYAEADQILSLLDQVELATQTQAEQWLNPDALYVVWAGANDYLQGNTTPDLSISNISDAIASLVDGGATRFLVANLPDLGQLPATRDRPQAGTLSSLTRRHNQALDRLLLERSQQPNDQVQIILLDIYSLYQEAITQPEEFGFANVMDACLEIGQTRCQSPNQFLFWDGIHPTTATHQILGDASFSILQENGLVQ